MRYNVHRSTTAGFTPSAANRIAQPTGTGYTDNNVPAGTYYYKVTAEDLAGNIGPPSNEASATVAGSGPVAAYGFDEGSRHDHRGSDRRTATTGRSRTRAGRARARAGSATRSRSTARTPFVTVPDSNSLDLTTGMTLEAWVRPNAGGATSGRSWSRSARATSSTACTRARTRTGRSRRSRSAARRGSWTAARRSRRRRGPISRRRTTGRRSGSTSTAPRSSSSTIAGTIQTSDVAAQDRWERDLGRVVHGADRRGAGLPPRAERRRDPGGHDDAHHLSGRGASERAGHALRDRRARAGGLDVGRRDRQHRRRPIQRASLDDRGLHAGRREPHSAAHRHELHEHGSGAGASTTTR